MFKRSKFPLIFNILLGFVISLVLTLFIQIAGGTLTLEHFLIGMVQGFCLNMTLETIIDLPGLGNGFLRMVGIQNMESPTAYFLRLVPIVVVLVLLMSLGLMFCEIGFSIGAAFFPAWLSRLPVIFVVAYITAVLTFLPCLKITTSLCSQEG